jgi:SpoVK/Ycf46/Vps4 family AAA+-type ATPase
LRGRGFLSVRVARGPRRRWPQRGGGLGEPAVTERVVNTLLAEIDGLEELQGVVVIGATNRPTSVTPEMEREYHRISSIKSPAQ